MRFTDHAIRLLKQQRITPSKTVKVLEMRDYDGYDEGGPKGLLWDLLVVEGERVRWFHRENWYYGSEEEYHEEPEIKLSDLPHHYARSFFQVLHVENG